jgi:hypothetical protein
VKNATLVFDGARLEIDEDYDSGENPFVERLVQNYLYDSKVKKQIEEMLDGVLLELLEDKKFVKKVLKQQILSRYFSFSTSATTDSKVGKLIKQKIEKWLEKEFK